MRRRTTTTARMTSVLERLSLADLCTDFFEKLAFSTSFSFNNNPSWLNNLKTFLPLLIFALSSLALRVSRVIA